MSKRDLLLQSWESRDEFFKRRKYRNYHKEHDFSILTGFIRQALMKAELTIEVGGGDFTYAQHLIDCKILNKEKFLSTDIPCKRVNKSKSAIDQFNIETATALEAQKFARTNTLFVAANVFGNLTLDDTEKFFLNARATNSSIALISSGLEVTSDEICEWRNPLFYINYPVLAKKCGLYIKSMHYNWQSNVRGQKGSSATYILLLDSPGKE